MNSIIRFELESEVFYLVAKHDKIEVLSDYVEKADATVTINMSSFKKLIAGEVSGKALFLKGDMKVSGDMSKFMKLEQFTQQLAKHMKQSKL